MKRLFLTYLGCIAAAFVLPVLLSGLLHGKSGDIRSKDKIQISGRLPEKINVYFADEGVTREIDFEEYIKGVLPAEMPASFEAEAQKAQAVAARTYAYYKYLKFQNDPSSAPSEHPDAAICTNPLHCNAYYTPQQLTEKHGKEWADKYLDKIRSYAEQTRGEILACEDEPILAVFHSSSGGGFTESSGDVWGKELPYLVSVKSSGEEQRDGYVSSVTLSHKDFTDKIASLNNKADFSKSYKSWVGKSTLTTANHIKSIIIGGVELKGTQIRTALGLKSTCFDISIDEKSVVFTVKGNGHGVGMSQYGANFMATNGADYTEILESYYTGANIIKY